MGLAWISKEELVSAEFSAFGGARLHWAAEFDEVVKRLRPEEGTDEEMASANRSGFASIGA